MIASDDEADAESVLPELSDDEDTENKQRQRESVSSDITLSHSVLSVPVCLSVIGVH